MMIMWKRIRAEAKRFDFDATFVTNENGANIFVLCKNDLKFHIVCPLNYPFKAPSIKNMMFPKTLDPYRWCLSILSCPKTLARFKTWDIKCTCCHSLTCNSNWNIHYTINDVVNEAIFLSTYSNIDTIPDLFLQLPIDTIEHIAHFAYIT